MGRAEDQATPSAPEKSAATKPVDPSAATKPVDPTEERSKCCVFATHAVVLAQRI